MSSGRRHEHNYQTRAIVPKPKKSPKSPFSPFRFMESTPRKNIFWGICCVNDFYSYVCNTFKQITNMKHGKTIQELAAEIMRQQKNKRDFVLPTKMVEAYAMNGELNLDFATAMK